MNTGDSCLITPYVPHSFTRDPSTLPSRFMDLSGFVRDVLNDLVHHDITRLIDCAGDRRDGPQVFLKKLERFSELRGLKVPEVITKLITRGHSKVAVDETLAQTSVDHRVIECISDILAVPKAEFEILQLEPRGGNLCLDIG